MNFSSINCDYTVGACKSQDFNKIKYNGNKFNFKQLSDDFDSFIGKKSAKKITDETNDGKFSFKVALKNFGKGVISPLTAVVKHPLATVGTLAGIGIACFAVPVLTPILTVGFGAWSVFELGKATYDTIKNYKNGNYDAAENGFKNIGQGFIGTALTFLGLKSSAKIAAESKIVSKTGKVLTEAEKATIDAGIKNGGYWNALKENVSIITTKEGWKTVLSQIKPSAIKQRFSAFLSLFKKPKDYTETVEDKINKFRHTDEGIRRATLTDKQIETEVNTKFNQVFEELGIPSDQRPKLVIKNGEITHGGGYNSSNHTIEFNPETYKAGFMEIDDVMMHEATHCREALLRNSLPKERLESIIKEDLSNRILTGEGEKIFVKGGILGADTMKPPKLPNGMKEEFLSFAQKELYTKDKSSLENFIHYVTTKSFMKYSTDEAAIAKYTKEVSEYGAKIEPILQKIKGLMQKYPEFQKGYKTPEEALEALEKYALSHKVRYNYFVDTNTIKGITPQTLNPEMTAKAEASLRGYIDTIEGNARQQSLEGGVEAMFGIDDAFNQYQFSPEEVLAQQKGNEFLIKNTKAELQQLKDAGNLTKSREAYLNGVIKKAETTIEYKTKGLEYYKLYKEHINNPSDKALTEKVKALKSDLDKLRDVITDNKENNVECLNVTGSTPKNSLYMMTGYENN